MYILQMPRPADQRELAHQALFANKRANGKAKFMSMFHTYEEAAFDACLSYYLDSLNGNGLRRTRCCSLLFCYVLLAKRFDAALSRAVGRSRHNNKYDSLAFRI